MHSETPRTSRTADTWAVSFGLLFPALITWIYFILLDDSAGPVQQTAYLIGKAVQFGFPVVWVVWFQRRRLRPRWPTGGVVEGIGFGALVLVTMMAGYHLLLKPLGYLDPSSTAATEVWDKLSGMGVAGLGTYVLLGTFYSLIHSGMEEYYWRWFVFGQLRRLISPGRAIVLSAVGFTLHHILVLGLYFGFTSPEAWLLSFAVGIGGLYWAWLYQRTDSLWGPWLGHLLIDAAIFLVGYDLVQPMLAAT